jgi:hypothetical protein
MENLYRQAKDQAEKMQRIRQGLVNDIEERKNKISLLDKIAFSSEQECKRTEQRIQQLTDKKDKLEELIANMSDDNEGYSKVKQIVKAILSDNKILISVSFAAVIQTLKADPQMIKLIQNIPSPNDGEQHKDNNNNITKYLEANKHNLLDLAEKHYKNLVEALRNNAIVNVFSNPILSLPKSSSTFLNPSTQTDNFRIEESEGFHNNKDDIAD